MSSNESPAGVNGLSQRRILGAAVSATLAVSAASASFNARGAEPAQLPRIAVEANEEAESIKAEKASSPKFTQPLLDTPQTLQVVTKEVLAQQGATTLSEALRNTPGITFLLGENGNTATGDSIFMRGFDTQGSIFIDGIRDIGTVSRDTFNTEQVEIAKGPSGADNGRATASGYVNLSTKVPLADDFMTGGVTYGSGSKKRVTADLNEQLGTSGTAFRLNVMGQDGGVAGRDHVERQSWAIAPSLGLGIGGATRAYFYLLHTKQDNRLDGGVPTVGLEGFYNAAFATGGTNAGVVPRQVDRENFYGFESDFEDVEATMFTARIEHDFSENLTLRNTSRYGTLEQFYVLTGINALTLTSPDPDQWTVARTRQAKHQENRLLTNQTNLTADFAAGGITHSLTSGLEFIYEQQFNPAYTGLGTVPAANLYNPNYNDPIAALAPVRNGVFTKGDTTTVGLYAFDTIKLTERWQLTAGVRLDNYETEFNGATLSTAANNPTLPVGTLIPVAGTPLEASDTLVAWKVGALFKPAANGSVYIAYSTSNQPPGGSNFTLSGTATNINSPNLDPQEATNLELGTKWDFLDSGLAVTAAIYRSENKNDLAQVDPTDPNAIQQFGKKRVDGIELGVVGQLTPAWQISAGIAKMDTEVVSGTATQTGAQINWSPELTFTSWTTYQLPFGLTIGGGVRYVDTVFRSVSNSIIAATTNLSSAPDYWVIDAMVAYEISDSIAVQLNGYNLADELYVASLNNSGARYSPGAPRSGQLTLNIRF